MHCSFIVKHYTINIEQRDKIAILSTVATSNTRHQFVGYQGCSVISVPLNALNFPLSAGVAATIKLS